jgi:hypothetical protein
VYTRPIDVATKGGAVQLARELTGTLEASLSLDGDVVRSDGGRSENVVSIFFDRATRRFLRSGRARRVGSATRCTTMIASSSWPTTGRKSGTRSIGLAR